MNLDHDRDRVRNRDKYRDRDKDKDNVKDNLTSASDLPESLASTAILC